MVSSCTWPELVYVRSSRFRSLFSMSIVRIPPPVASNTTGPLVAFTVVKIHALSFIMMFTRRVLNLVLVISTSVMMLNGIHRTVSDIEPASNVPHCSCRSQHWPSRLACHL